MARDTVQRRLAAILAADVVGWSRLMGADEAGTLARLKGHRNELIDPKLAEFGGRIVKTTGDGVLVEFSSAVDAVKCASEIQDAMIARNEGVPELTRMQFRIGINLGEIIIDTDGDIFGDGVNIAARLEELAAPGTVNISEDVYRQILGRLDAGLEDLGPQTLKNIANPVKVYRVGADSEKTPETAPPKDGAPAAGIEADVAFVSRPAVAVLPFDNMSRDEEQEYFVDGIAEDIITGLSLWRTFPVIARNSSFSYKGQKIDVKQVGQELGARYVLEGSVRKAGNRLRITAQLIDSETSAHVWAERFDREMEDIFDLQDEITERIVTAIAPEMAHAEAERSLKKQPADLDAWDLCHRGQWHINRYSKADNVQARELLERSAALDPNWAVPRSWVSFAHLMDALIGFSDDPAASMKLSSEAAEHAVRLDSQDPLSRGTLAIAYIWQDRPRSIIEAEKSISLNPSLSYGYIGLAGSLGYLGRWEEAVEPSRISSKLSPRDMLQTFMLTIEALIHLMLKDYDKAIDFSERGIREQPSNIRGYIRLACALAHKGDIDAARTALERGKKILPNISAAYIDATHPFDRPGDREFYLDGLRKAGWEG